MSYSNTGSETIIKSSKLTVKKISNGLKTTLNNLCDQEIKYNPWTKVSEIRTKIASINGIPSKNIRLFYKNIELMNGLSMIDYGIPLKKHPEIYYEIVSYQKDHSLEIYGTFPCSDSLQKIIEEAKIGFIRGLKPKLIEDGTSGVYQIRNIYKETIAIFKPFDEEPNTPNNQKGYTGQFGAESFRRGILSGEATIREEATFLLDNFSRIKFKYKFDVPATTFVEMCHKTFNINMQELKVMQNDEKVNRGGVIQRFLYENLRGQSKDINEGSDDFYLSNMKYKYIPKKYGTLQKFIKSAGVVADYSYSLFSVEEAHKIMILDFRILNCDRNDENILLIKKHKKKSNEIFYKLVPIDHAYSFPSCLEIGDFEICWMSWSQAKVPFTEAEKKYIDSIDIIEDMENLNKYIFLRPECWKYFRISNTVLKVCTKYNLTPYEIGTLLYHDDYDNKTPSKIKLIVEKTEKLSYNFKGKRIRLLSSGGEKEKEKKYEVENKRRQNSFFRQDRERRTSILESTQSVPKKKTYEEEEEEVEDDDEDYENLRANHKRKIKYPRVQNNSKDKKKPKGTKKAKKTSHKSSLNNEYIFDSPYQQLYFQNFTMFLEELIKNEFPQKHEIFENNSGEFELRIEEKNSTEIRKMEENETK